MLFPLVGSDFLCAQQSCELRLRQAQTAYEEGRINTLEDLLNDCLESGQYSDEEKAQAYRLLTLSFLYLDEPQKAEIAMAKLLKSDPEYRLREDADPKEFEQLYERFRTRPVLYYGAKAGVNATNTRLVQSFGLENLNSGRHVFQSNPGFSVGMLVEYPLSKTWSLYSDPGFHGIFDEYRRELNEFTSVAMIESRVQVDLPLLIKYQQELSSKLKVYAATGPSMSFVLAASADMERTRLDGRDVTGPSINLMDQRSRLIPHANFAFGVDYKIGKGYLRSEVRYLYALGLINNPENRLSNEELLFNYAYIDSDVRKDLLSLQVGYVMPIYLPKIIK